MQERMLVEGDFDTRASKGHRIPPNSHGMRILGIITRMGSVFLNLDGILTITSAHCNNIISEVTSALGLL